MYGPRERRSKRSRASSLRRHHRKPVVESIEGRLLPGDTVGWAMIVAAGLLRDLPPAGPTLSAESSALAVFSASQPVNHPRASQLASLAVGASTVGQGSAESDALQRTAAAQHHVSDALFTGNSLTWDFATDPLNLTGSLALAQAHGGRALAQNAATGSTDSNVVAATVFLSGLVPSRDPVAQSSPGSSLGESAASLDANLAFASSRMQHPTRDDGTPWPNYAHDAQHTGLSGTASKPLSNIVWSTPVDLNPPAGTIFIHYGSPVITQANTVIVPVKYESGGNIKFKVEGFSGADGTMKYTFDNLGYKLPPHNWVPSYSPTLTSTNRLYLPGPGGTVYFCDTPDSNTAHIDGQLAFYGIENYDPSFDNKIFINTPITADSQGNLYFGFMVTAENPLGLKSGIARMQPNGAGFWLAASTASNDPSITKVVHNAAPALSADESVLYITVSDGDGTGGAHGYLVALNAATFEPAAKVFLQDPKSGNAADLNDNGTASPTVGPDGDVYIGVLENPFPQNHDRGWLLHFDATLSFAKLPGAFGWDDTASIVPASLVTSYQGPSDYLLMSKYNDYGGLGGTGINKIAIVDPNVSEVDPVTGATVMNEVLTIAGLTPDPDFPDLPGAVREWCINTAAVDPFNKAVLANSEDGKLYKWDLTTNTFSQIITLTSGIGEAYTPTLIGPDGTVYAINDAILFAVNQSTPSP